MTACTCPDCGHEFEATPADGHMLLCGDATSAEDVARLGDHGHLMVTDPPYGVEYEPEWRNQAGRALDGTTQRLRSGKAFVPLGARAIGKVTNDERADWSPAFDLFQGDVAYIWSGSGGDVLSESLGALKKAGLESRTMIVWRKQHFAISRGHYHFQHEVCWYAVRKGRRSHWRGAHDQSTVWDAKNASPFGGDPDDERTGHSTQKPVEVMRRPMLNNSNVGDLVYEPFSGSGTTIIAAESVGRRCRAIELEPVYVDVAVLRWQKFAGKVATLEGGGTFEEVAATRAGAAAT